MRLLVKFGANVLVQEPGTGDGIFHVLARQKIVDLTIAFFLYAQGSSTIPVLTNSMGVTASAVSAKCLV